MKRIISLIIIIISIFALSVTSLASTGLRITTTKNANEGIKISWKASKRMTYKIYRSVNGSKYSYYTKRNKKSFLDKYTETGDYYKYKIKAYKYKHKRKKYVGKIYSKKIQAIPKVPIGLATTKHKKYYELSWSRVHSASAYNIFRKTNDGDYVLYDIVDATQTSYKDSFVSSKSTYKYKIQTVEYINGVEYYSNVVGKLFAKGKKGIDVSYYNGKINWKKVRKAGISFAMIRLGYGTKKGGFTDIKLDRNYKQARKYGVKIGYYFYSYANNTKQAKKEAKYTLKLLKKYPKFHYPVAYDFEEPSRNKPKYKKQNTKIITTYLNYLEKRGYDTCLYSSVYYLKESINMKKVTKYGIWLARWTHNTKKFPNGGIPNIQMWQYSNKGRIKGITGRVDLDIIIK